MLSKPIHGWTTITIDKFTGQGSYLTDVPMDCLNAFISSLKYNIPAAVYFDEEGSEFNLVSFHFDTYIIEEKEETKLTKLDISFDELASQLIKDIELNISDWVNWMDYKPIDDKSREKELKHKVTELKSLLSSNISNL